MDLVFRLSVSAQLTIAGFQPMQIGHKQNHIAASLGIDYFHFVISIL